ncbi:hypothetical protein [Cellvibrio sp. OA-2007]|uniref:hypothetical protein n=1 Tax=Cellvibrio sp. OA-2007 TaxID=529823 RepID=UPI000780399D|nr:hypothetical protein [Cellvibrio sp. OA-2007]
MFNINQKSVLCAAIFLLGGCLNNHNVASETNTPAKEIPVQNCRIPTNAFSQLPTDVLDGTEVVHISNFKPAIMSATHFNIEIGGANINIDVQALGGHHKAQRNYIEPGLENSTSTFDQLCIKEDRLYGETVRGIFTEKGILWLELNSENEFISSDLWIYLEKN